MQELTKIEKIERLTDDLISENGFNPEQTEVVIGSEIYLKHQGQKVGYFYQKNSKILFQYTIA